METRIAAFVVVAAGALLLKGAVKSDAPHAPVLVELFTSEGCSSCPPADAVLEKLDAGSPQVIVLSEHVDYWNNIGWKDPYSSAAFSERQNGYAQRFHLSSIYTPQMVVNGAAEFVGSDARMARTKIAAAGEQNAAVAVEIFEVSPGTVRVEIDKAAAGAISGTADVMVAVASNETSTNVLSGENGGRRLHHVAVVRTMTQEGGIRDGESFSKEISLGTHADGLRVVAWVQEAGQGRVLGAAMRPMTARQ